MVTRNLFICMGLFFSFGVFPMQRVVIPQRTFDCTYGKLAISPLLEPQSFYAGDREILDAQRYLGHSNHVQSCISIFETMKGIEKGYYTNSQNLVRYNCLTHQQNIDVTNSIFHSMLVDAEDGIIEASLSVAMFPYWKSTKDYLSSVVTFNGEQIASDLWEKVAVNLTALRNLVLHEDVWRSEYTDFRGAIQRVIETTADWPTEHYMSWSISKAVLEE